MFEALVKHVEQKVTLTDEEWILCKSKFVPKKLRKKQLLLTPGDVCSKIAFVEKGLLYAYNTDDKGAVRVANFAIEGWWISDLYSYFTQEPARLTIEVLEDAEILLLHKQAHEELLEKIPTFNTYTRHLYQNAYVAMLQRLEDTLGLTAEEKYHRLLEAEPAFLSRVPQHLIASYLGVKAETISRIKGKS